MIFEPRSADEVRDVVRDSPRLWIRGAGSKPALSSAPADASVCALTRLSGVEEYDPAEYTFTALAGTRVAAVAAMLAAHGQYLPCDLPFAPAGATLGGAVAAGLSGPGRHRYGGIRDFIIGVRFVDGMARLVRAGGRVVKNAAGFDLAKLLVGSLGRLGVLVSLSFKVFPRPESYATVRADFPDLGMALESLVRLTTAPFDLEALDLEPPGRLWIRLGGAAAALAGRVERVRAAAGGKGEVFAGAEEQRIWDGAREFAWASPGAALVKVPVTPSRVPELDGLLAGAGAPRRYSVGGNILWVAWERSAAELDQTLSARGLSALVVRGDPRPIVLGSVTGAEFARRVKAALDPAGRFPPFPWETPAPLAAAG